MGIMPIRARRILVFVGTREALEQYDLAGVPIITPQLGETVCEQTVRHFSMTDDGVLVVAYNFPVTGWRVPSDTFVVFDESWPHDKDHPRTMQAKARVAATGFARF